MPWTPKQRRYMYANHPEIAKRVTSEPGYHDRKGKALRKIRKNKKKGT